MKEFSRERGQPSEREKNTEFIQHEVTKIPKSPPEIISAAKETTKAERIERTPVSRKAIEHLHVAHQRGPVVMDDPHHGAIHGTSIETLQMMVQSGFMCGTKNDMTDRRSIWVYPTNQIADKAGILSLHDPSITEQLDFYPEDSINSAKDYAETIAKKQAFLTKLEIPLSDAEARMNAERLISVRRYDDYDDKEFYSFDEAQNYFLNKNLSPKKIEAALEESLNRKGFLIGFSPEIGSPNRILEGIMLFPGDKGSSDIRISFGEKGLPYTFLSGIEPLGPIEEAFLKNVNGG